MNFFSGNFFGKIINSVIGELIIGVIVIVCMIGGINIVVLIDIIDIDGNYFIVGFFFGIYFVVGLSIGFGIVIIGVIV